MRAYVYGRASLCAGRGAVRQPVTKITRQKNDVEIEKCASKVKCLTFVMLLWLSYLRQLELACAAAGGPPGGAAPVKTMCTISCLLIKYSITPLFRVCKNISISYLVYNPLYSDINNVIYVNDPTFEGIAIRVMIQSFLSALPS